MKGARRKVPTKTKEILMSRAGTLRGRLAGLACQMWTTNTRKVTYCSDSDDVKDKEDDINDDITLPSKAEGISRDSRRSPCCRGWCRGQYW